jgi:hypothetical protein
MDATDVDVDGEDALGGAPTKQGDEPAPSDSAADYIGGGLAWQRWTRARPTIPPDEAERVLEARGQGDSSDEEQEERILRDPLDDFLVSKLNPSSRTHDLPFDETVPRGGIIGIDKPGLPRTGENCPSLKQLAGFRKFKELFFEKSQERPNETAGLELHEPVVERRRGTGEDPDYDSTDVGSKVAQNILQNCVLSAIRKDPDTRRPSETQYIVQFLSQVEFLHNLTKQMLQNLAASLALVSTRDAGDRCDHICVGHGAWAAWLGLCCRPQPRRAAHGWLRASERVGVRVGE